MRGLLKKIPGLSPFLTDLVRLRRAPAAEMEAWRDWWRTRAAWKFLRLAGPAGNGKTVLSILLSDDVYEIKLHGMLLSALRLRGWRPVVLTITPADSRARRYMRAFGVTDFVSFSNVTLTSEEREACATEARQRMDGPLSFAEIKQWRFEGAWIGPQVLSTVSRATYQGAPDPNDPEVRARIAQVLPQVLENIYRARRLVKSLAPSLALTIEANYALFGAVVDMVIDAGVDVVQFVQPWHDAALGMKRLGPATRRMHPSSVAAGTLEKLECRPWGRVEDQAVDALFGQRYGGELVLQARNQPKVRPMDRAQMLDHLDLPADRPIAVVFSHVLWDANLFYGDDLFDDYGHWFIETIRAACANPRVSWLVKMHPANLWKRELENVTAEYAETRLIREKIGTLPDHVRLLPPDTEISTLSLFETMDYAITVRGTAGMEAPCFGKPCLTAGSGRYSGLGITMDATSRADYLERLGRLHEVPALDEATIQRARRHALAAFRDRLWHMHSFKAVFNPGRRGHPLASNLWPRVDTLAALDANGDLLRWAIWAEGRDVDYIEES